MSTILSLIEACLEGKPVDVAEHFKPLIAERVADRIQDQVPVVVKEFFDGIAASKTAE
jgi:hypothetical protein